MPRRNGSQVRICGYPAYWLKSEESFANPALSEIIWSTGSGIQPADIQVFCINDNVEGTEELANDPRVGAVHSLWKATSEVRPEFGNEEWPEQAQFSVLVRLEIPVPKGELADRGLLATCHQKWPQNRKGIILRPPARVRALAEILSSYNPGQRQTIAEALGVETGSLGHI